MALTLVIDSGLSYQAADITTTMEGAGANPGVSSVALNHFKVSQNGSPDKSVNVTSGFAWVPNSAYSVGSGNVRFWPFRSSAVENVTIPDNATGNPRIDRICLKVDTGATAGTRGTGSASIVCVTGTAAASPVAPATPNDHLSLAYVAVANGFTSITDANITDDRAHATLSKQGGWEGAGETLTYTITDAPTYVMYASGDRTSKYSAGMKWKITQGTVTTPKYFITTLVTLSGSNTLLYLYGGTDYTMSNATIASAYFSTDRAPNAFPMLGSKWSQQIIDTTNRSQATPTASQWYNVGGISLTAPIGIWDCNYGVVLGGRKDGTEIRISSTIGRGTATQTNPDTTAHFRFTVGGNGSAELTIKGFVSRRFELNQTSKQVYYVNTKTDTSGATNIENTNDQASLVLTFKCMYL